MAQDILSVEPADVPPPPSTDELPTDANQYQENESSELPPQGPPAPDFFTGQQKQKRRFWRPR
jgi:hypothetical protein